MRSNKKCKESSIDTGLYHLDLQQKCFHAMSVSLESLRLVLVELISILAHWKRSCMWIDKNFRWMFLKSTKCDSLASHKLCVTPCGEY